MDKQKQIQSITSYLIANTYCILPASCAKDIHGLVIPEGAVVITEEELAEKQSSSFYAGAKIARYDTAKKFAEKLKELVADRNCNDDYDWEDVQVDGQIFVECIDEILEELTDE